MKKFPFILLATILAGCSQQEPAAPKPPVDAHKHILVAEDAPEGYEYSNINELVSTEDQGLTEDLVSSDSEKTTTPEQCAPLATSAMDFIAKIYKNPDTFSAADFSAGDINATVSLSTNPETLPFPADLAECASFSNDVSGIVSDYSTTPLDMQIEGAENLQAAKVTIENAGNPLVGEPGESEFVAHALVDDAVVSVSSHDEQALRQLMKKQVNKVANR